VQTRLQLAVPALLATIALSLPVAMLALRVALVIISFGMASAGDGARRRLTPLQWLRMVALEVHALVRFQRLIMGGSRIEPVAARDGAAQRPLLILLHGIYCNGGVWRPILDDLSRRTGCEILVPTLEPPTAGLKRQTDCFARWLERAVPANTSRKVIVVAHSMGGIVARLYLGSHPWQARISRLICIGSPHGGSQVAHALRTPIGRDLRTDSAILRTLALQPDRIDLLNVFAEHDNLVVPARNSERLGTRSLPIAGCGHMSLIYSPEVRDRLVAEVSSV
jgi:triacylglycerol lipase